MTCRVGSCEFDSFSVAVWLVGGSARVDCSGWYFRLTHDEMLRAVVATRATARSDNIENADDGRPVHRLSLQSFMFRGSVIGFLQVQPGRFGGSTTLTLLCAEEQDISYNKSVTLIDNQ